MPHDAGIKVITLDAAGTLIHVREPVGVTYARVAGNHGLNVDADVLNKAFRTAWKQTPPPLHDAGRPPEDDDRSWWHQLAKRCFAIALNEEPPSQTFDRIFDELYFHYAKSDAWSLYDDVLPALEHLSATHQLLVVSNFDRRLRSVLHGLGVSRFFSSVVLSSEAGASKPHRRMFAAALAACGYQAHECLHVGDDPTADGEGAATAGFKSFLLQRPHITLATLVENLEQSADSSLHHPPK